MVRGAVAALLLGLLMAIAPRPEMNSDRPDSVLFAQPWLLRALSGSAAPLMADWLWLKSHQIDEWGRGEGVRASEVYALSRSMAILDPHFTVPVIYGATYLASIHHRSDLALDLLHSAQWQNPRDFDLLMGEALLRVTYAVNNSGDRLRELAGTIETLDEHEKRVGAIQMGDWLSEALVYVRTQEGQRQMLRADLRWLLARTSHPERRKKIEAALTDLQRD
jgi:hypothetical protein